MSPPSVRELPSMPGVYRFRDGRGRVLYLGRATNLRSRVASYWGPLRGRRHLARMVSQIHSVEAVECDSAHEAAWLERLLMQRSKPRWNRTVGGMETPVMLRVNSSERSPGLSLVHEVVDGPSWQYFGPYLGGNRLRVALQALQRVSPLALTASMPSGSARDLARIRMVGPDDREVLLQRISAALQREPDAVAQVHSELTALRDASADRLEFERAAVIQAEIDALTWLLAPQRVMIRGAGDATFTGWAANVAVSFGMRAGAVDSWTITRGSLSVVAAAREATPPAWREFADRAAQLAARLDHRR